MLELPPASEAVVSSLCYVSFTASNYSMSLKPRAFVLSALLQNLFFSVLLNHKLQMIVSI